jgi:hypothetical protein
LGRGGFCRGKQDTRKDCAGSGGGRDAGDICYSPSWVHCLTPLRAAGILPPVDPCSFPGHLSRNCAGIP